MQSCGRPPRGQPAPRALPRAPGRAGGAAAHLDALGQGGVAHDGALPVLELGARGQLAVDDEEGRLEEGAALRQLLDGVAPVPEHAVGPVDVADGAAHRRHVGVARVVHPQAPRHARRRDLLQLRRPHRAALGHLRRPCPERRTGEPGQAPAAEDEDGDAAGGRAQGRRGTPPHLEGVLLARALVEGPEAALGLERGPGPGRRRGPAGPGERGLAVLRQALRRRGAGGVRRALPRLPVVHAQLRVHALRGRSGGARARARAAESAGELPRQRPGPAPGGLAQRRVLRARHPRC